MEYVGCPLEKQNFLGCVDRKYHQDEIPGHTNQVV